MTRKSLVSIAIIILCVAKGYACKCGVGPIYRYVGKAYDVVIAKVVSEKKEAVSCFRSDLDYSYEVEIEFSYKDKLRDTQKIFGGKGHGSCGAILQTGVEYVLLVFECHGNFVVTMCTPNVVLDHASAEINYLNKHFNKNYPDPLFKSIVPIALICLLVAAGGLVTFNQYKKRSLRRHRIKIR